MELEMHDHIRKAKRAKLRLNNAIIESKIKNKSPQANVKLISLLKPVLRRIKNLTELQLLYCTVSTRLNIERTRETHRTMSEHHFQVCTQSLTKTHVTNQVWIGNHCADYFTTSLGLRRENHNRGFTQKGIVFEIDGSSHDNPIKQKKDDYKNEFLLSVGILPLRIKNNDVCIAKIKSYLLKLSPISSHDRNRLKNKIALLTCAYNATDSEWEQLAEKLFIKEGF